ncbi:MAG: response regulator [Ghiorsea sp.]|nr:response regulator [Ghiorsea sp.]
MDQNVTEALVEPLVHLLNNAVAHGIEDPEKRQDVGKDAQGQVSIIAKQSGSEIIIEVIDDGQGIDTEIIKRVAVERGVTTQDEINLMDSGEIMELIFRPGFSTLSEVGTLAGRGIGMNVVQDTIRRLTGTIRVYTEIGKGTRFVISVPISIAVQDALMFKIGGQKYGMLTHIIDQALPLSANEVQLSQGGKRFISYGSEQVPLVDLRRMMVLKNESLSDNPFVIIAEHIEGFVGIVVDEVLGEGEIMVRDLDPYIKRYLPQGLMGNTITEDGSVVMLLEPYGIKEMGRTAPDQDLDVSLEEDEKLRFNILLVDDSLIAREVEKNIFENLGFVVDTAIDGMDGLEKLQSGHYDMLITDLEMPRLDGFGLVRQIRNQTKYEDLPIIVISTRESAGDRLRALEVGADSYMVKQHLEASNIISTVKALVGPDMVKERGVKKNLDTSE